MLSIRQDLKTSEAATAFNRRINDYRCEAIVKGYHAGCIGELACVHCYHVISDSTCLCIGRFTCPKCGKENGRVMELMTGVSQPSISPFSFLGTATNLFAGDWPEKRYTIKIAAEDDYTI